MNLKDRIGELRQRNGTLIAAHRGTCGGNIIDNTIAAYENALRHGADIVEIDAAMTRDGVFYAFHDGSEYFHLGAAKNIRTMDSGYVDQLFLRNPALHATTERINRLEDVFNFLRGRCPINVDRSWFYWKEIIAFIKKMRMEDQVILKSPAKAEYLETLASLAPGLAYMPILETTEEADLVEHYEINYIMAELVFESVESPVVEAEFIKWLKDRGLLLWVNVLTLHEWTVLSGGKDDYHAITGNPDDNWGWCIDRGFDILQTDWPLLLKEYLRKRKENIV